MELAINFSGGTVSFPTSINVITLTGTGTLSANYTITSSGTISAGSHFTFYYQATVDKDSYNFNILGTNLSTTQLNRGSTIEAVYNGTSWDLNITPNTVSTNWLTFNDMPSDGSVELIVVPVSFESGEQCKNIVFCPYGFDLLDAWFHPTKVIAGTDDGTITIKGDSITLRTINVPASTALDIACASVLVAPTQISPESNIECGTSKTTAGGKGLVSLVVQRYE